jgi:hypothetical protein
LGQKLGVNLDVFEKLIEPPLRAVAGAVRSLM